MGSVVCQERAPKRRLDPGKSGVRGGTRPAPWRRPHAALDPTTTRWRLRARGRRVFHTPMLGKSEFRKNDPDRRPTVRSGKREDQPCVDILRAFWRLGALALAPALSRPSLVNLSRTYSSGAGWSWTRV